MIRGVPKSEPPWSLKPQGWRSLLESLMSRVPAVMANYLPINVTNHSRYLSVIATYLFINLSYTVYSHSSSLPIWHYFRHFHQSLIAEISETWEGLTGVALSQVTAWLPEPGDSRYCLCFVSACDLQLVAEVMSPGSQVITRIKSRVYFVKNTRWRPGETRGVDISLLSSWHYDLWTQFMTVTAINFFSLSEALLTSYRPIRDNCLYLSLHPWEIEAVLCSCLPHLWAFFCDRAARHRGLWEICFWSFNIPDDESLQWLCRHNMFMRFCV